MLSALYLPEILVKGERVREGKKTRERLVTPKPSLEIRHKYHGLVSGRNPAGHLETRVEEHSQQPEHVSRICPTNPVKTSKRISGARQK